VLIEAGVNINATDFLGGTALTRASRNGHVEIVQLLLKCCPDLEAIDVIAWKDLLEDMDASQKSFVSDDIEPVGCTALWLAARHGHYEIAMALIEAGADVNKGDYYAETPFMCSTGCPALVRDLIAAGADVNAIGGDHDGTPLCYAGNSVNKLDSAGHTVLSKLVDSAPAVQHLIDAGADVNTAKPDGNTPLHLVSRDDNVASATILLADQYQYTPLHVACGDRGCGRSLDIVTLLCNAGADIDALNKIGRTPLYEAVYNDNHTIVRYLTDNGANPDLSNPLHTAVRLGKMTSVRQLLLAGADASSIRANVDLRHYFHYTDSLRVTVLLLAAGNCSYMDGDA
jgi:ankyrin repeat protein